MDALLPKLRHPLLKIRARALASLLFKLRERLLDARSLARDHHSAALLAAALVACCAEPTLEIDALHALELLLEVGGLLTYMGGAFIISSVKKYQLDTRV